MEDRSKRANELIERIKKDRGLSRHWRELLAHADPDFTELNHEMTMHVLHKKGALPRKYKELLLVCMDALTFYEGGLRLHLRNAFEAGATKEEVVEALETTCLLGIHPIAYLMPILEEELEGKEIDLSKAR